MGSVAKLFSKPMHTPPEPSKELVLPFAKVGVEIEVEQCRVSSREYETLFGLWDAHEDRSLRNNGMEFTTRGGYVGPQLCEAIRDFCKNAKDKEFSDGMPRAAIHLHIDCTDLNRESDTELLNMMLVYIMFEHVFFSIAGEWRKSCGFCDGWLSSQEEYGALSRLLYSWNSYDPERLKEGPFSKYMAVNVLPLKQFGTVEFRHLPTTFDAEKIIQWLNLCLCMKRYALRVDRDPVSILTKSGPEALIAKVFKGYEDIVEGHVSADLMWAAVPDIMSLKLLHLPRKYDSWEQPDNPLIEKKRNNKKNKEEVQLEVPVAANPEPVRMTTRIYQDDFSAEQVARFREPVHRVRTVPSPAPEGWVNSVYDGPFGSDAMESEGNGSAS